MSDAKMTEVIHMITEEAMDAAIELLAHAKFHRTELAQIKTELLSGPAAMDGDIHAAFRLLIAHALTDPGGHVERTLRKNGFLIPELTNGYVFSEGAH